MIALERSVERAAQDLRGPLGILFSNEKLDFEKGESVCRYFAGDFTFNPLFGEHCLCELGIQPGRIPTERADRDESDL
jgi:hypothetical protein